MSQQQLSRLQVHLKLGFLLEAREGSLRATRTECSKRVVDERYLVQLTLELSLKPIFMGSRPLISD